MFHVEKLNLKFARAMNRVPEGDVGVAVSGGSDSLALLHLGADWAQKNRRTLKVATIDHRLRPESIAESQYVKKISTRLSIEHTTLTWLEKPSGNIQKLARDARHRLLQNWSTEKNLSVVLLGHTLEDNAETIMIRLIRGSGVDGLVGISQYKKINNLVIFRPLLQIKREELRTYLIDKKISWIDDPSNFDERFQRVKVRKLMPHLADLGLTISKINGFAEHMKRVKVALDSEVINFAISNVEQKFWGDLEIRQDAFIELPNEFQLRLLSLSLRWISGNFYRPRFKSLKILLDLIIKHQSIAGFTLMGCLVKCRRRKIVFTREFSAIPKRQKICKTTFVWDKKWNVRVDKSKINHFMVGPLGKDGVSQIKKENIVDIPFYALNSSIALFENGDVKCVPMLSFGSGLNVELIGGSDSFFNFLTTY